MASKTAKKKTRKAAPKGDLSDRIIDATLALAAGKAWRDISLAEIAEAAEMSLSDVYGVYASKGAILAGFSRRIDAAVLAGQDEEDRDGSARDRLFDVIMRRFDALAPAKAAVGSIVCDMVRDPVIGLCGMPSLAQSMACMLEAADLSTSGLRGALRIKALSAIYLAAMRVWLRDESPDLSQTMACLDRYLRRVEWLAERCSRLQRKQTEESPAPA
jgi:AcrR family transcriptional regulator